MAVSFRTAGPRDVETLVPLVRDFWVIERLRFSEPGVRQALLGLLEHPELGRVVLMEEDGAALGYFVLALSYSLEYFGRDAFVDELFVCESRRGRGLGARALAHAAELCAELGVKALHLEVDHVNPRARALYERSGFEPHERALMTRLLAR
jgi:GNAT superfamily N-acetyltransferase